MHSGVCIYFSFHPLHVKRGVATSLLLCTVCICDPQELDGEIDFLRLSFSKLGYPRHVLDVALSRAQHTYHDSSPKSTLHLPILSLPYNEIYFFCHLLHPLSYKLLFRQVDTPHTSTTKVSAYVVPLPPAVRGTLVSLASVSLSACLNINMLYTVTTATPSSAITGTQAIRLIGPLHIIFPSAYVYTAG